MAKWHVGREGQQLPAMEHEELQSAVAAGEVRPTDLVWTDGMPEWRRVADLPELISLNPTAAVAGVAEAPIAPGPLGVMNYQMPQAGNPMFTSTAMESLRRTKGWARFIAITLFVLGGLFGLMGVIMVFGAILSRSSGLETSILIFGMVGYGLLAAFNLVLGLLLNRFASSITALQSYGREDQLERVMECQRKFWRLAGIGVIAVFVAYIGLMAAAILFGMMR